MLIGQPQRTDRDLTVRSDLRAGDIGAIARLHGTLYAVEHGFDPRFEAGVAAGLAAAVEGGWPERGAVRIAESDGRVAGSVALTLEGPGAGRIRWFLLDPMLRGTGLGRRLLAEVVAAGEAAGLELLDLQTFSDLRVAAHLYRSLGFAVVEERRFSGWGRPILLQRYERRRAS